MFEFIDIVPIGLFKPSVYGDLNQMFVASCNGPTSHPTSARLLPLPSYLGFGCILAPKPDSCRMVTDNKVGSIFSWVAISKISSAIGSGMEPPQPVGPCEEFCGTPSPQLRTHSRNRDGGSTVLNLCLVSSFESVSNIFPSEVLTTKLMNSSSRPHGSSTVACTSR